MHNHVAKLHRLCVNMKLIYDRQSTFASRLIYFRYHVDCSLIMFSIDNAFNINIMILYHPIMHSLIRLSFYIFPLKALWFYCGCVCGVCANPPAVCTLYFSSIKTNLISPAPRRNGSHRRLLIPLRASNFRLVGRLAFRLAFLALCSTTFVDLCQLQHATKRLKLVQIQSTYSPL